MRYDPLQTWHHADRLVGYRVQIVPGRGSRPRDQNSSRENEENQSNKSLLFSKISTGEDLAIVISTESQKIGTHLDDPKYHQLSEYMGITIVNKFSPLDHIRGYSSGVALVSYSNIYSEDLSNMQANTNILYSMKNAIQHLSDGFDYLKTSLIFFNIGPNSGASLKQLHSQIYLLPENSGLISHSTLMAYQDAIKILMTCLTCKIANEAKTTDHLNQSHDLLNRMLFEDEFFRILVPFAPIRALSIRIISKRHIVSFAQCSQEEIYSLGKCLKLANDFINIGTPSRWPFLSGRTISFRQYDSSTDFHFFIDMIPAIPFGGSELVDSLSVTTLLPDDTAKIIKSKMNSI